MTTTSFSATPFNRFLIHKEMTASDVQNLTDAEESVFWDEYAAWKNANVKDTPGAE